MLPKSVSWYCSLMYPSIPHTFLTSSISSSTVLGTPFGSCILTLLHTYVHCLCSRWPAIEWMPLVLWEKKKERHSETGREEQTQKGLHIQEKQRIKDRMTERMKDRKYERKREKEKHREGDSKRRKWGRYQESDENTWKAIIRDGQENKWEMRRECQREWKRWRKGEWEVSTIYYQVSKYQREMVVL